MIVVFRPSLAHLTAALPRGWPVFRFVVALSLLATPALAWDNTNSGHGAQSIADGGPSQAQMATGGRATSRATGGAGGSGGAGGRGGTGGQVTNNVTTGGSGSGGGSGYGDRPVSSAYAPSVYGGTCSGPGASAGLSTMVVGLSVGGNQIDRVCQLHMIGMDNVARAYLCRADPDIRKAMLDSGAPCAADVSVVPAAVSVGNTFTPSPWCAHASKAQRAANAASCG